MPIRSDPSPAEPGAAAGAAAAAGEPARRRPRVALYHGLAAADRAAGDAAIRLLAGLAGRGLAVRLYTDDPGLKQRALQRDLLARLQPLGDRLSPLSALRLGRELRRVRPDVLVLAGSRSLWTGGLAGRRGRVPRVLAWLEDDRELPTTRGDRFAARRWIQGFVFGTDALREKFLERVPEPGAPTVLIPPAVTAPTVRGGASFRAVLGIPLDAPLLGSLAPLLPGSGHDRLIRLLSGLGGAHAVVLGEGRGRRSLERRAAELGVADRLHLPGEGHDTGAALDAVTLCVDLSERAGVSHGALRAMAAGVPVAVAAGGGAAEAVVGAGARPGGATGGADRGGDGGPLPGVVLEPEDDSATATLSRLLAERGVLRRMGEAGRRVAGERFSLERALDGWEKLLRGEEANG